MVEHWSPKPSAEGSSPSAPAREIAQNMMFCATFILSEEYRDIYKLRKETIKLVFADTKGKQSMRHTQYRRLEKVKAEAALRFACMNLGKLAKRRKGLLRSFICGSIQLLTQVIQKSVATLKLQPIFVYGLNSHADSMAVLNNYYY